nr:SDR family oxidoreductase [Sinorhizobium glycinis]
MFRQTVKGWGECGFREVRGSALSFNFEVFGWDLLARYRTRPAVLHALLHRRLWETNYNGTLIACQVFGRALKAAGRGAILNIGSLASFAPLSLPAYTAGKAAVLSLTQMLAAELGPHGVRVNGIAPGYTMSDGLRDKIAQGLRNPEEIKATTALRAFVEPEHIAEAAWFLCSQKAASITGVMLPVDAGWLVQAPYASYMRGNPIRD